MNDRSHPPTILLAFALLVSFPQLPLAQETDLAITDVTLIDGSGEPPREGVTILVRDGLVERVAPANEVVILNGKVLDRSSLLPDK